MRKSAFNTHGAFIARLSQCNALRLQVTHGYTEVWPHKRLDDADDLIIYLPRCMDITLKVGEEIFRITQRCDLDHFNALSFIKTLGDNAGIFKGLKMDTPVIERFVKVLQLFIQKAARRWLQSKDTQKNRPYKGLYVVWRLEPISEIPVHGNRWVLKTVWL